MNKLVFPVPVNVILSKYIALTDAIVKTSLVLYAGKSLNTPMPTEMVAKMSSLNGQPTGAHLHGLQTDQITSSSLHSCFKAAI